MLQRLDISNRWRMFEPCTHGDCAECAEQTVDPDGKVATCACKCHVWLGDYPSDDPFEDTGGGDDSCEGIYLRSE